MDEIGGSKLEASAEGKEKGDVTNLSLSIAPMFDGGASGIVMRPGGRVALHFDQPPELHELIKTLAQLSGKSVILDRKASGVLAVPTEESMTPAAAYEKLASAIKDLGLEVVEDERSIKIRPKVASAPIRADVE
jgi:hypothetical protein